MCLPAWVTSQSAIFYQGYRSYFVNLSLVMSLLNSWERNSYWGAETISERSEKELGSGGKPPGKFFMTTPFRSLENAPFLENVLLTEAKDHDQ